MSTKPFDIAIIGGGIAGLSLAIALHSRNIPVTIYEQASHFGEIGAGVSFTPNALQAMKVCHQGIFDAFEKVCTRNQDPDKQTTWFDFHDGYEQKRKTFTIHTSNGQNGVHRAHFLNELIKLVPSSLARFGKRLDTVTKLPSGRVQMKFVDGSTAETDAIVGCDGIKSRVRQLIVGEDHPSAKPQFTYKIAYRGLVPMEQAINAVGEEKARNSCMHLGPDRHMLTFGVNNGTIMNIVAFSTTKEDWPDTTRLTRPATRTQALKDFEGWGNDVTELLKLTKPDLDVWAIFDTSLHPLPTFTSSAATHNPTIPLLLTGDAAHATSPHHGAGAGLCIEDSAVLASLLSHPSVQTASHIHTAFQVFDSERLERGHFLAASSRYIGDTYEWRETAGDDFTRIEEEIYKRHKVLHDVDVPALCERARGVLEMRVLEVGSDARRESKVE